MQEFLVVIFYFVFFVYLYIPFVIEDKPTGTKMEARVQKLKTKATRISNFITDSPYFAQLCDWAYSVCDPEGTNHIGKADLYAGILMVHIKLAKLAGSAATFPPPQATVDQLFDACDTNSSGGINREEFDIFLSVSSAQIFGRVLVNWLTLIFVIPYYAKHVVDSFELQEGSYWELVAEQACGLFLFFLIIPIFWNMIDNESHKKASQKADLHRDTNKIKTEKAD